MWDGKRFKELKGTRKPDGQLLSPRNERDTVLSIAPWMLILFQSHPELATGPFLPLPQFPHPPKRGARDAQPVKPPCEQITKLKQNFPMNLPLHFTFRPVTMTDQHPSALKRFYFSISITNSGGNLAPLLSSASASSRQFVTEKQGDAFPRGLRPCVRPRGRGTWLLCSIARAVLPGTTFAW